VLCAIWFIYASANGEVQKMWVWISLCHTDERGDTPDY